MRHIIILPEAAADMRDIWKWIEDRDKDPTYADKVNSEIVKAIRNLGRIPGIGHIRNDVKDPHLRFKNVYSYLVAYKYDDETVTIVRVVHGTRDFTKLF